MLGAVTGPPPLRVASWNLLADSYMDRERYARSPASVLDPARRHPALVEGCRRLDADVLCLQEVEPVVYALLARELRPLGYEPRYGPKAGKPEGCATFYRLARAPAAITEVLHYQDGEEEGERSGDVALITFHHRGPAVVNTHLRWSPPEVPPDRRAGVRQARELSARIGRSPEHPWIVCGDLNAPPGSPELEALREAGLADAHAAFGDAPTVNAVGGARRRDFLLHGPELDADPDPLPPLGADEVLPGEGRPADHLPVAATVRLRRAG